MKVWQWRIDIIKGIESLRDDRGLGIWGLGLRGCSRDSTVKSRSASLHRLLWESSDAHSQESLLGGCRDCLFGSGFFVSVTTAGVVIEAHIFPKP